MSQHLNHNWWFYKKKKKKTHNNPTVVGETLHPFKSYQFGKLLEGSQSYQNLQQHKNGTRPLSFNPQHPSSSSSSSSLSSAPWWEQSGTGFKPPFLPLPLFLTGVRVDSGRVRRPSAANQAGLWLWCQWTECACSLLTQTPHSMQLSQGLLGWERPASV